MKRENLLSVGFGPRTSLIKRYSFVVNTNPDSKVIDQENIPMTLDSLIGVLRLQPKERTQKDLQFVQTYAREVTFFQKLAKEEGDHAVKQCAQTLYYEVFGPGQFVFRQGDTADRFYIILEGICGVIVSSDRGTQEVRIYERGESFGELALLQNQPRAASIQCKNMCHFAVLHKEDYEKTVQRLHRKKLEEKVDFLLSQPMFRCWTKGSMTRLSYYFFERSFSRKQVVYKAGDPSNELFLIRKGEFRLLKEILVDASSPSSRDSRRLLINQHDKQKVKKQVEIASLTRGEVFGVEELFDAVPRTCTCVCYTGEAEAYMISREDFFKRVKNEEKLAQVRSLIQTRDSLRTQRLQNRRNLSSLIANCCEEEQTPKPNPEHQKTILASHLSLATERFFSSTLESPGMKNTHPPPTADTQCHIKRSKTWDKILSHTFRPVRRRKLKDPDFIVNIHTEGVRRKLAEKELEDLRLHLRIEMPTSRSAVSTPFIRTSGHASLVLKPQVAQDGTPSAKRGDWRLQRSSHSLFRPMRLSRF